MLQTRHMNTAQVKQSQLAAAVTDKDISSAPTACIQSVICHSAGFIEAKHPSNNTRRLFSLIHLSHHSNHNN